PEDVPQRVHGAMSDCATQQTGGDLNGESAAISQLGLLSIKRDRIDRQHQLSRTAPGNWIKTPAVSEAAESIPSPGCSNRDSRDRPDASQVGHLHFCSSRDVSAEKRLPARMYSREYRSEGR